jgi:hypothetical protein
LEQEKSLKKEQKEMTMLRYMSAKANAKVDILKKVDIEAELKEKKAADMLVAKKASEKQKKADAVEAALKTGASLLKYEKELAAEETKTR